MSETEQLEACDKWKVDPVSSHHLDSQRVLASGVPQRVTHARFGGPLESRGKGVAA